MDGTLSVHAGRRRKVDVKLELKVTSDVDVEYNVSLRTGDSDSPPMSNLLWC